MRRQILVKRTDHAHFIGDALELREDFADLEAGLAGLLEFEGSREEDAVHARGGHVSELLHLRLRIESIEVRGRTAGEDMDDVLGLGGERRLAGLQVGHDLGVSVGDHVVGDHGAEGERAHAQTGLAQELAAGVGGRHIIAAAGVFHDGIVVGVSVGGLVQIDKLIGANHRLGQHDPGVGRLFAGDHFGLIHDFAAFYLCIHLYIGSGGRGQGFA